MFSGGAGGGPVRVLRVDGTGGLPGGAGADPAREPAGVQGEREPGAGHPYGPGTATGWLAPNPLKRAALTDTLQGVYLPFWTFDAQAHCSWSAEAGYYYYETETYTENGEEKTRQVRHTRWEPVSGLVEHFFDDELVSASKGVPEELMGKIEPFPTVESLVPYDGGFLAGWTVEQYQVDLATAADEAEATMQKELWSRCEGKVPGDTSRGLQIEPLYTGQTFKHVLLPVWVLSYRYGKEAYQVLINGYTGQIAGKYPVSALKVALLLAGGAADRGGSACGGCTCIRTGEGR